MSHNILTLLMLCSAVWGYTNGLDIKVRFSQIEGLKQGDRVIFELNHIGTVTGTSYSQAGDYVAEVRIKQNFKKAATEHSRFFIVTDPADKANRAIEMIRIKKGGLPLEGGVTVEGATRFSALFGQMGEDLEKTITDLRKRFDHFSEDMKGLPESEEFKNLQKELDRLLEEMKRSGSAFREKMQKEILPRLQEELEKLKERLRKLGREKEVEPLEVQMEEMRKI
ncbi:MAG: hypothetical protein ISR62_06810 [Desulfobacteraceae bacterium]|nr:hypothetical protein [Desulfobacterales bacterium]MBL6968114.1 hypothetical protein [Desulfobacteraceae bacterium]MBL7102026.1 hypothetical protein [Desulfobacteraceae bacterium]